uniref:Uncharacterized protein n=1 Tax=Equus caballus TaxID=9796 RepID=A0A9L0QZW5_HORSE
MEYLSSFLILLRFLSTIFYSFQCTDLSVLWLSLFLGMLFFCCNCKWDCTLNFSFCDFVARYRKTTDCCVLLFYPATLPYIIFIISKSLLVNYLGFSIYKMMSSANSDSFTSSFPIWILSIYFSCLIALAKTSSTMLNKSGESGDPFLVPVLRGIAFSFSTLRMILAVGLSYMAFIMLRYFPSISILFRVFIINGCCILSNAFSAFIKMIV